MNNNSEISLLGTPSIRWDRIGPLIVFMSLVCLAWLGWRRDAQLVHQRISELDRLLAAVVTDRLRDYLSERARDLSSLNEDESRGLINDQAQFSAHAKSLLIGH